MKRGDIKIKDCFWFQEGKCIRHSFDCPFQPEQTAFTENPRFDRLGSHFRCLEFRQEATKP